MAKGMKIDLTAPNNLQSPSKGTWQTCLFHTTVLHFLFFKKDSITCGSAHLGKQEIMVNILVIKQGICR